MEGGSVKILVAVLAPIRSQVRAFMVISKGVSSCGGTGAGERPSVTHLCYECGTNGGDVKRSNVNETVQLNHNHNESAE